MSVEEEGEDEDEESEAEPDAILKPIYPGDMMRLELETPVFFLDNGKVNHEMIGKVFFIPANSFTPRARSPVSSGTRRRPSSLLRRPTRKGSRWAVD